MFDCARRTARKLSVSARESLLDSYKREQRALISRLRIDRPARVIFEPIHGRHLVDDVASPDECCRAAEAARGAMRRASDTDGDCGRLFPPAAPEAAPLLGERGFELFAELSARVTARVRARYGADAEPVNELVSWIAGRGGGGGGGEERSLKSINWLQDSVVGTYGPHIDKANQPHYDISALLYLGTAGVDFEGGLFAFNDPDCDRLVAPVAGRMLAFSSGFENLHQVRPVSSGERFVLSVWFRRGPGS